jgi:small subunit ribosomal protein S33
MNTFIFLARPTNNKSMKVVRMLSEEPSHKRDFVINWYPRHVETHLLTWNLRNYGLFRDEHADWKDEMKRLRYLRGKKPPPKGQGKRATKK